MPQTKLGTFHDASGKITVAVFERKAGNQQSHFHDFACTVPFLNVNGTVDTPKT